MFLINSEIPHNRPNSRGRAGASHEDAGGGTSKAHEGLTEYLK